MRRIVILALVLGLGLLVTFSLTRGRKFAEAPSGQDRSVTNPSAFVAELREGGSEVRLPEVSAAREEAVLDREGESVLQDAQGDAGTEELWLEVVDEHGQALPNAAVAVSWEGGRKAARPREEDGLVWVGGIAPGLATVEASAPGFAPSRHSVRIPITPPAIDVVQLRRAGAISGEVVLPDGGRPEGAIEVLYQGEDDGVAGRKSVADRTGTARVFRIEDAPVGLVRLAAISQRDGFSSVVAMHVSPDEENRALLRLASPRRLSGLVVDARDGRPLAGARVQVLLADVRAGDRVPATVPDDVARLPEEVTNDRGVFRFDAGIPDGALVEVEAGGYSRQERPIDKGSPEDLGTFALAPSQTLTIRLSSRGPLRAEWEVASEDGRIPPSHFDERGFVSFEEFSAGYLDFYVRGPERRVLYGGVYLDSGAEWNLDIPVDGLGSVLVDFAIETRAADELLLIVTHDVAPGFTLRRAVTIDELVPIRIEGIPSGPVSARLRVPAGPHLGMASGTLRPGSSELRLTIRHGRSASLRLVDGEGVPLDGASVYVVQADGDAQGVLSFADESGRCSIGGLPDGPLVGLVTHRRGARPGIAIQTGDEIQTIVVEPFGSVAITLSDDGIPVAGASCLLVDPRTRDAVFGTTDTDGDGRAVWAGLHEGTYLIQARHPRYANINQELEVSRGQALMLQVQASPR